MESTRKLIALTFVFTLLLLITMPGVAARQIPQSLLANAKGKGTLTVGQEQFEIYAVIVKLKEGGDLELTLVTEITVFISGKWSASDDNKKGIDLEITGGATPGGVKGNGNLFLRPDGKSIASLSLEGSSMTRKKKVVVTFVAED